MPFTWYHLNREYEEDVILHYNEDENVIANYSCPVWDLVGDNYCDDEANIAECGYDLKDCCEIESDRSTCKDCLCYIPEDKEIMLEEQCFWLGMCPAFARVWVRELDQYIVSFRLQCAYARHACRSDKSG